MVDKMRKWYVLHAKTGRETDIKNAVNRYTAYTRAIVPQQEKVERKSGVNRIVVRNLFPGYVFVNTELTDEIYYKLTGTPGVIRILGYDDKPQPINDSDISRVLDFVQDGELIGISDVLFEGSNIKVAAGPLMGMEGKIVKIDRRKGRAKVNISILDEMRTVEFSINVIQSLG
jgi:transcriptional antiterminator NusG